MTLLIGAALQNGHYVLDSVTHQDDAGAIYRGTHVTSGQVVSVKLLKDTLPEGLDSFLLRAELIDQIQRLAQLQHPNIVDHLCCFEENGLVFIAMEADVGLSLAQIVGFRRPRPLSEATALRYLLQIADAVLAIRQVGLRSLDLDPRLIFRKPGTHRIVLTGLGASLVAPPAEVKPLHNRLNYSTQDCLQENSQPAQKTKNSDIYRLSVLLYYLLTGQLISPDRPKPKGLAVLSSHRQPCISKETEEAIQLGLNLPNQSPISTLKDWLALLPDVTAITSKSSLQETVRQSKITPETTSKETTPKRSSPIPADFPIHTKTTNRIGPSQTAISTTPTPSRRAPQAASPVKQTATSFKRGRKIRNVALIMTVFASALMGLGFGTVLRFSSPSQSGGIRFDPDQSFPPLEDWLEDQPDVNFDSPYLPSEKSLADQADVRRIDTDQPNAMPTGPQPIDSADSQDKEFDWLDQEAIIPDYPTPKQPSAPLGWPAYPDAVNSSPEAEDSTAAIPPATEPEPSTAPTLSTLIETLPATEPSEVLRKEVEDSLIYSGPDTSAPVTAPPPVLEPPTAVSEFSGESADDPN